MFSTTSPGRKDSDDLRSNGLVVGNGVDGVGGGLD